MVHVCILKITLSNYFQGSVPKKENVKPLQVNFVVSLFISTLRGVIKLKLVSNIKVPCSTEKKKKFLNPRNLKIRCIDFAIFCLKYKHTYNFVVFKFKFINFYKFQLPLICNLEISTEPSMDESDSHMTDFFIQHLVFSTVQ